MNSNRLDGANWHFRPDQPISLGCAECFLLNICGGLRVEGAALDCQRFCCHEPNCSLVCFNSAANYARRLREVGGSFDLNTIPSCQPVTIEQFRGLVPLIHHAYSRNEAFHTDVVAISLFELLDRDGAPKYLNREEINKNFRVGPDAKLIVSGMHQDRLLERFWSSPHRNSIAAFLKSIGVSIFTPPNFSVYNNVPRPENFYNIKRIGLVSYEFLSAGVPTALHINACTDTDYERYTEFLAARTEYEAISFDFITGPGFPSRMPWHIKKLIELRNHLGRQIQLVLRGGTKALNTLAGAYSNIAIIDSTPLLKALHRQRIIFGNDGTVSGVKYPLPKRTPVDQLFVQNFAAKRSAVNYLMQHPRIAISLSSLRGRRSRGTRNADYESGQLNFLTGSSSLKSGTNSIDAESVIATSKSKTAAEIEQATEEVTESSAVSRQPSKPRTAIG